MSIINIPNDNINHILSFLDLKTLVALGRVSSHLQAITNKGVSIIYNLFFNHVYKALEINTIPRALKINPWSMVYNEISENNFENSFSQAFDHVVNIVLFYNHQIKEISEVKQILLGSGMPQFLKPALNVTKILEIENLYDKMAKFLRNPMVGQCSFYEIANHYQQFDKTVMAALELALPTRDYVLMNLTSVAMSHQKYQKATEIASLISDTSRREAREKAISDRQVS